MEEGVSRREIPGSGGKRVTGGPGSQSQASWLPSIVFGRSFFHSSLFYFRHFDNPNIFLFSLSLFILKVVHAYCNKSNKTEMYEETIRKQSFLNCSCAPSNTHTHIHTNTYHRFTHRSQAYRLTYHTQKLHTHMCTHMQRFCFIFHTNQKPYILLRNFFT